MSTPPLLELRALRLRLGGLDILRGVDLQVHPGERLAIIGPNGAGKSSLFHLISGRTRATGGEVWLRGQRIDRWPAHRIYRAGLARSFQITQLFPRLSVWDNLRCAALWQQGQGYNGWQWLDSLRGVSERAEALLHRLGLAARRDVLAQHLTYAEQRALDMGLALAGAADVVLLDEPTSGMNQSETRQTVELVRELTEGKTLLMVEHDMGVVFELADRIAVLVQGELVALGTPQDIRQNPVVREAYLGPALAGLDTGRGFSG